MAIVLPKVFRPALPGTRSLLQSLLSAGVLRADGCVITSADMGEPPVGYDRVATSIRTGYPSLEASRIRRIRSAMTEEVTAIVEELTPSDCHGDRVVQATYSVDPAAGVELVVEMHGLVDRVACVSIS